MQGSAPLKLNIGICLLKLFWAAFIEKVILETYQFKKITLKNKTTV